MPLSMCPFHGEETPSGVRQPDGSYAYTCDRTDGHPVARAWSWLEVPTPPGGDGLGGIADDYGLQIELPAAVAAVFSVTVKVAPLPPEAVPIVTPP